MWEGKLGVLVSFVLNPLDRLDHHSQESRHCGLLRCGPISLPLDHYSCFMHSGARDLSPPVEMSFPSLLCTLPRVGDLRQ